MDRDYKQLYEDLIERDKIRTALNDAADSLGDAGKKIKQLISTGKTVDEIAGFYKQVLGAMSHNAYKLGDFLGDEALVLDLEKIETTQPDYFLFPYFIKYSLNIICADGGVGKGTLSDFLAGLASAGRLSEIGTTDETGPLKVLMFSIEDDPASKVRPEIELMGGDITRIKFCAERANGEPFTFVDKDVWEKVLKEHRPGMVIIDNLGDFGDPSSEGNSYRAVARELSFLVRLAKKYQTTIILIMHENRAGGFMGSNAARTKARSFMFYKKTSDDSIRRLVHDKGNIDGLGPDVFFKAEKVAVQDNPRGVWKMEYLGTTRPDTVEPDDDEAEKDTPQTRAIKWLEQELANGPVADSLLAKKAFGIYTPVQITRARKFLGAQSINKTTYPKDQLPED
jgi:hypothetical protein